MRQVEHELSERENIGGETTDEMIGAFLEDTCGQIAASMGLTELWKRSRDWPGFSGAWKIWRTAVQGHIGEKFPETKGIETTRYQWERKEFLASLRLGGRDAPEFYKERAWFLFRAARLGDVGFFEQFAIGIRHKGDPRLVRHCLLLAWMAAALWSATDTACAELIIKLFGLTRGTKGGVRSAWHDLKLSESHSSKPIIKGWIFSKSGPRVQAEPVFYPGRLPKV
jgi:hypothetical protein